MRRTLASLSIRGSIPALMPTLIFAAVLCGSSVAAVAQTRPPNLEPLPDVPPPPPPTLQLAPGQEPEVRIIRRERETVEEFRIGGQLYMMRVTPAGGVPFYLIDYFGDGNFVRSATVETGVRVPMWVIRSW